MSESKLKWDLGHSTLLDHVEPAGGPCVRRGKLHCKGPGPHAAPAEGDHFASHREGACEDRAGARWRLHWYALWTRQGWRCGRCGKLKPRRREGVRGRREKA